MLIRSGFVSNSSSSSFIISLPIKDLPLEKRVNTPELDSIIEFYSYNSCTDLLEEKLAEKENYLNIAKEENCYIMEVQVEGWESPDNIEISFVDIPNAKVLKGNK